MPLVEPRRAARTVGVPTTHVWGSRDVFMARKGAELTAEYVTGPFHGEILDAAHWIPEERPAELAAVIAARANGTGRPTRR
jgi:pimeloyl-ACP methyl ester carboxylesterase